MQHSSAELSALKAAAVPDIVLDSPRLYRCVCQADQGSATVSPLQELVAHGIAPERLYLESRWASLVSYGAAAGLLADVLPITAGLNATTVRQHTLKVAERAATITSPHMARLKPPPAATPFTATTTGMRQVRRALRAGK